MFVKVSPEKAIALTLNMPVGIYDSVLPWDGCRQYACKLYKAKPHPTATHGNGTAKHHPLPFGIVTYNDPYGYQQTMTQCWNPDLTSFPWEIRLHLQLCPEAARVKIRKRQPWWTPVFQNQAHSSLWYLSNQSSLPSSGWTTAYPCLAMATRAMKNTLKF